MDYKFDCHFFTGYKPCSYKRSCVDCPHYKPVLQRIAIISLDAMGAVLRSTCLLPAIRREYPKSHITWITLPHSIALLQNNPFIDRLLPLNTEGVLAMQHLKFDLLLAVDKSLSAGALAEIVQAQEKRGFGLDASGVIKPFNEDAYYQYDLGLNDEKKFFINQKPETQQITESMGLKWQRDPYILEFNKEELEQIKGFKEQIGSSNQKVIGYNTGCSELFPYKKFTLEKAIALIAAWRKTYPETLICLLGGGKEDDARVTAMKAAFAKDPMVFASPCLGGLRSGLMWMDVCDMIFSGCSLGMHMAISLKKYVLAWFGLSCAQEVDLYDKGEKLKAKVSCSPCWKKSCTNEPKCFNEVDLGEILAATGRILNDLKK